MRFAALVPTVLILIVMGTLLFVVGVPASDCQDQAKNPVEASTVPERIDAG